MRIMRDCSQSISWYAAAHKASAQVWLLTEHLTKCDSPGLQLSVDLAGLHWDEHHPHTDHHQHRKSAHKGHGHHVPKPNCSIAHISRSNPTKSQYINVFSILMEFGCLWLKLHCMKYRHKGHGNHVPEPNCGKKKRNLYAFQQSPQTRLQEKLKEKLTLFSDHNGSLLRWQPRKPKCSIPTSQARSNGSKPHVSELTLI